MRVATPYLRAPVAIAATVLVAACSLEVNINLDGDDSTPTVSAQADVPVVTLPPRASVAPEAPPRTAPRPTPPPRPLTPPTLEPSDAVRDALLRRYDTGDVDPSMGPTFTPFTNAPRILNRQQIIGALTESYPPLLRDAEIGGTVKVFFFIRADGTVGDARIDQSSGHAALDAAALAVAHVYRFSPALNYSEAVPVWVSLPISFQVR